MNIAVITLTYNDGFKLNEWHQHYMEYKDDLYTHIIVDNGSSREYFDEMKKIFTNSHIIELGYNGGCTGAYNAGITHCLNDRNIDYIALVGNDIRIQKDALTYCAVFLKANNEVGIVAPILLDADSDIVSDFGCDISNYLTMIPYGAGEKLGNIKESCQYCEAVTGGMNIAKRGYYEEIGLQDDLIFMYSDEVDMGIRAKKKGIKSAVLRDAISWHQHINPPGKNSRPGYSKYLPARNKIYLAYKHYGFFKAIYVFLAFLSLNLYRYVKFFMNNDKESRILAKFGIMGSFYGIIKNMKPNKFSQ